MKINNSKFKITQSKTKNKNIYYTGINEKKEGDDKYICVLLAEGSTQRIADTRFLKKLLNRYK